MITALYASLLTILMIGLSIQVIKQRRKNRVAYADGDVEPLKIARSAQSNAVEYIPITLMLMGFAEFNGLPMWLVHVIGVSFVIGRLIHAKGILGGWFRGRILGMQITLLCMLSLIVLNLVYLPFDKIF
ncbi:hypothetical protein EK599_05480 [Vibrio sp. T187]|uniref:MAPEG family protein n=1 Tax=Vibrio TaxID=662 RepID=UPI0010C943EA|nr:MULTISPECIES: MAPEG family protein [Vibrio]MBW3695133.1 hypothetical protein [Vibrio sp. T187]